MHQVLTQQQEPYAALASAAGLQPDQLDSLVQRSMEGRYIEISAASFLPDCDASDHAAAAPIIFHSRSRGRGTSQQQIECGGGSDAQRTAYSTTLLNHLKQSLEKGVMLAYGDGASAAILFRIASAQLPQGEAAMPWVLWQWALPAADLTAMADHAAHLFKQKT